MPGLILQAAILGIVIAVLLSRVVLARYNRAVTASMAAAVGRGIPIAAPVSRVSVPLGQQALTAVEVVGDGAIPAAFTLARRRRRTLVRAFVVAGALHALVAALLLTTAVTQRDGYPFSLKRLVIVWALLLWPIFPTTSYIGTMSRHVGAAGAFAVLALVWLSEPAFLWTTLYLVGVPMLAAWALSARRVRAIAPFAFVGASTLIVLLFFALQGALVLAPNDGFSAVLGMAIVTTLAVAGATSVAVLARIAASYRAKQTSDLLLLVDSWWLAYSLWLCLVLSQERRAGGLTALAAFGVYKLALWVQLRGRQSATSQGPRTTLLLLRVFGFRSRTEDLLASVGHWWRYLGSLTFIGGPDVATAILQPHEAVEYLTGCLSRRFVRDRDDLEQRFRQQDVDPDRDGRFRVNAFYCHDNSWRATVQRLAGAATVVLMDVRSVSRAHGGIAFELEELVRHVPVGAVLLLTDEATDEGLLAEMLRDIWMNVGSQSVNAATAAPSVRLFRWCRGGGNLAATLKILCEMVSERQELSSVALR